MSHPLRAIVFDCFGVLTTDVWKAFLNSLPADADFQAAHSLNHQYDAGRITLKEFMDGVQQATGQRPQQVEDLLHKDQIARDTRVLNYIAQLRGQGYKIGLLSNIATNWIREVFLSAEEQALFDYMTFSYEVGLVKPDPRIFQLTCDKLGVLPTEAVFIDDNPRHCAGAKEVGMTTILYTDFESCQQQLSEIINS